MSLSGQHRKSAKCSTNARPLSILFPQLQRHGARYPTDGASAEIKVALKKLQGVKAYADPSLEFLKAFVYDLGNDGLVPFGVAEYVAYFYITSGTPILSRGQGSSGRAGNLLALPAYF